MRARALAVATALATLLALPAAADAATFVVTDTADGAPAPGDCPDGGGGTTCSVRDAIQAANTNGIADTVELAAATTYSISLDVPGSREDANAEGDLDLVGSGGGSLTIEGNGATLEGLGATATERVLEITGAGSLRFELRDLTITGGRASIIAHGPGGGVSANGNVLFERVSIVGNTMETGASSFGGGLAVGTGDVEMRDSLVSGNVSQSLGGGVVVSGGELTLANTTVAGNTATSPGGGIYVLDGGTLHLRNATVARNGSSADGGNLFRAPGASGSAVNTIIASPTSAANCETNTQGWSAPTGGNVSSTPDTAADGCRFGPGSAANVDPLLGTLAANGGPTSTLALGANSPARDAGTSALGLCPATDQRGQSRPRDGDGDGTAGCDPGAYEAAAVPLKPKPPAPRPPGTPPPGPGVVPDVTPPGLALRRTARQRPLRNRNRITLRATSSEDATLRVTGSLRVPGRRRAFTFTPVNRTLTAGRIQTIRVAIPRRARARVRRALRAGRRLRANLRLVAADAAGNQTPRRTRVTLIR
jgi:hypothetical protein